MIDTDTSKNLSYSIIMNQFKSRNDIQTQYVDIEATDMRKNSTYIRIYILWMNLFFLIVIPFLVLIILNTIIYIKIKRFEKRSRENEASQFQLRVSFAKTESCDGSSKTISTYDSSSKLLLTPKSSLTTVQRRTRRQQSSNSAELANSFIPTREEKRQIFENTSTASSGVEKDKIRFTSTKALLNEDLSTELRNGSTHLHPKTYQMHEDSFQTRNDKQQTNLEPLYPSTQCQQSEDDLLRKFQSKQRCKSEAHIMKMDIRKRRSIFETIKSTSGNIVSVRKRELILARISIYIVFVMLICHSIRLIPNTYEMIQTYSQVIS